jgi:Ca-activated chloride channel family protein
VQADITNIALEHHLVTKFTSLVAVDVSPTKPAEQVGITKVVANKVKAAKTATSSQFWMLLGLVFIVFSVLARRKVRL